MKVKAMIAKIIAKLALKSAKTACYAASFFCSYQPKEPANLKNVIK